MDKRNLDFEEIILQLSRIKGWLPFSIWRRMMDKLINRGKLDDEALKVIKEEKSSAERKK